MPINTYTSPRAAKPNLAATCMLVVTEELRVLANPLTGNNLDVM